MIKIVIVTKSGCIACSIVKKVITEAINHIDSDINFISITNNEFLNESLKVNIFPTTIFYKECKSLKELYPSDGYKEIARLVGSFPIDYLNKIIDKLNFENNE